MIGIMRKAAIILAALALIGCANTADQASADTASQAASGTAAEETAVPNSEDSAEAGEAAGEAASGTGSTGREAEAPAPKKETVTIVIPTVYESVTTQEEADEICKKNGYESAELLEDGSLRITMSPEQYSRMLEELRAGIDKGIEEILGSENYPAVQKIEYNEDYSVFTVTVNDEIGIVERQLADELIMYGTYYHVCSANDAKSIRVDYVDQETGEVLESADSGDLESAY